MKENWRNKVALLSMLFLLMLATSCREDTHVHAEGEEYTCPMHPQIVRNEPGTCPICGMDLVRKGGAGSSDALSAEVARIAQSAGGAVISSVRTVRPEREDREVPIQTQGVITYDTRRIQSIAARFGGRIERLYVWYNFQAVSKGQKLFDIYSPQIVTAQKELIYLLENDPSNESLLRAARQKLILLGLTDSQIKSLEQHRKADFALTVYSPYNGYVIEDASRLSSAPPPAPGSTSPSGGMGGGMSSSAPGTPGTGPALSGGAASSSSELSLREGMYVEPGQTVFNVANTEKVWAEFRAYPEDLAAVQTGQPVEIVVENNPARTLQGKVDFIEPFYGGNADLPGFRVYLPNPDGQLRIGNLVRGTVQAAKIEGLWLPRSAVVDLGERQVVYRQADEAFRPVAVTTGQRTGDWVEIISGVTEQDQVAENAQFMVGSESFIKVQEQDDE